MSLRLGGCRAVGGVGDDPRGLPLLGIEHDLTGQVRALPAPGHQMQDAPCNDQVNHQRPFQPFQGTQLQRFYRQPDFKILKKFRSASGGGTNQSVHDRFQGLGQAVGEQPPFQRFFSRRWILFPR